VAAASLKASPIVNNDTILLKTKILRVAHLPTAELQRSSCDEMVASGTFMSLGVMEWEQVIGSLYTRHDWTRSQFEWSTRW